MTTSSHPRSNAASRAFRRSSTDVVPFAWSDLLPLHRLSIVAKTPLLIALGASLSGADFHFQTVGLSMALATLLWASLYALNEATDLSWEREIDVGRPLRTFLLTAPLLLCILSHRVSPVLFLYLGVMTAGQFAYCVPPLRWKRHWLPLLLLGGALNPVLRVACGAMWGTTPLPLTLYGVLLSLHLGSALRSRVLLRERDGRLGYRIAPQGCERAGRWLTGGGLLGSVGLCLNGVLPSHFLLFAAAGTAFSLYAWSGRITRVAQVRRGWFLFVALSMLAVAELMRL